MKKLFLILLLLAVPALAEWKEYKNAQAGFRASFPEKVTFAKDGPMEMFHAGAFTVAVLPKAWSKSRYGLLKSFLELGPDYARANLARNEREVDERPGLELSGVDHDGSPVLIHLVHTPSRGYAIIGRSFDMKENLQFVNSFRFVP